MIDIEVYSFILCLIVFTAFTTLFSYMIYKITSMELTMIYNGVLDERVERQHGKNERIQKTFNIIGKFFSLIICLALCVAFAFSVYMNITEDKAANGIPSIKVVKSASMAEKYEGNSYLFDNNLNDQLQTFDLIITRHIPDENELKLYDIVVYEQDDMQIIHRIVAIEEPNKDHPNERYFLLQGDAVEYPDKFPVRYSQMRGIYRGERIPMVGSFVMFLQSPAGWLCILLALVATIATPIIERKISEAEESRMIVIHSYRRSRRIGR